jgi:hypothetical protein
MYVSAYFGQGFRQATGWAFLDSELNTKISLFALYRNDLRCERS